MKSIVAFFSDWTLASYLRRRAVRRDVDTLIIRKRDGALFIPGSPQNYRLAFRVLWAKSEHGFYFYRCRPWRDILIAAPRVVWRPTSGEFETVKTRVGVFQLPPWPEPVETRKIRQEDNEGAAHEPQEAGE